MQTPQEVTVRLAQAYALTEILPLRHSSVQEALQSVSGSLGEQGLDFEIKGGRIWVDGDRVVGGEELDDLGTGLARCGVTAVHMGRGLDGRTLGTFLDSVRIASISGHLANLKEMVAFHEEALRVTFGAPTGARSELTQPAGAIFAGALAATRAPAAPERAPAPQTDGAAENREAPVQPGDSRAWDPPGVPASPPDGSPPPEAPEKTLTVDEFRKGVELFLSGPPDKRRAWIAPLTEQASRVDVDGSPGAALDVIVQLLGSGSDEVDDTTVPVALALSSPVVAEELVSRLGLASDEEERGQLLKVASAMGGLAARVFAEELVESEDRRARRALVHALAFLGEDARGPVEALLDRDEWYVVRNALTVLGSMEGPDTVRRVAPGLRHADARVRRETVMALVRLGDEEAGRLIAEVLADEDADVRAAATMGVGILSVRSAAPVLRHRLASEENEGVRIEALRALGKLTDDEAVPIVRTCAVPDFFSRPSKAVRIAAFRALRAIGTPEARHILEEASDDRDPEIRAVVQQAVEALS